MNFILRLLQFLGWRESIETRLAAACAEVGGLKMKGDNGSYPYLRMSDIADALRGPLFSRGLVLIANDVECHERIFSSPNPDRAYTEFRVRTEFTVSDGRQSRVYSAYGVGRDMDGKALFAAQTGAMKSWLKRLGLIFGERDDPEVEARKEPEELPKQKAAQLRYQKSAWKSVIASSGKTEAELLQIVGEAMGEMSTDKLLSLSREDFDRAMKAALQDDGNLTELLTRSVKEAKARRAKPQPIVEAIDSGREDEIGA
jgi:phage FluMu protein gp41